MHQTTCAVEICTFIILVGWEKRYRLFKNNTYNNIAKLGFLYVLTYLMPF